MRIYLFLLKQWSICGLRKGVVLVHTSSSFERPLFWGHFGLIRPAYGGQNWPKLSKGTHITIRVSKTFCSKVLQTHISKNRSFLALWPNSAHFRWASLAESHLSICDFPFKGSSSYKKAMTDGRTDGYPNSIGPQLLGWGLINAS